jgi:hypothetical protein
MKKIQIFIEHDIIIRHFLLNNTFADLEKNFNVQFVFAIDDARIKTDIKSLNLKSVEKIPVDRKRLGKLRHLSKIQTLTAARKNKAYKQINDIWKTILNEDTYKKMWLRSLPFIYPIYKRRIINNLEKYKDLENVIDKFSPDLIIHPSVLEGLFISDLSFISEQKKIPFIALMNSWDNPSTKAMIIRPPDYMIVWGEQTKQHAIEFLGMKPEQIKIFGAAQFEVYKKKPQQTKRSICADLGIDKNVQIILYAGSSKSINEIKHLQELDNAVENKKILNCKIIFRPHPWRAPADNEPDFYDINWKHVYMEPSMKNFFNGPKIKGNLKVNLTDYMDTHNILSATDLLISNVSTIMLEAAIHEKPVICLVSDDDIEYSGFLRIVLDSIYFKELLEKLEIPRCKNYYNLPELCNRQLALASNPDFKVKQKEKVKFFVEMKKDAYSKQLLDFANQLLN